MEVAEALGCCSKGRATVFAASSNLSDLSNLTNTSLHVATAWYVLYLECVHISSMASYEILPLRSMSIRI